MQNNLAFYPRSFRRPLAPLRAGFVGKRSFMFFYIVTGITKAGYPFKIQGELKIQDAKEQRIAIDCLCSGNAEWFTAIAVFIIKIKL